MRTKLLVFIVLAGALCTGVMACQGNASGPANSAQPNVNSPKPAATPDSLSTSSGPENVKVISADKLELAGTFYASAKPNSPAVLLLHQFGSNRRSYNEFALRLQAKGIGVLAIDGRGFGDSVKTADGKTIGPSRTNESVAAMNGDVAAAFEFLGQQKNVDASRVGIVGASYGSSLAIIYAEQNSAVKAVALLSPGLNYFGNLPTEPAVKTYGNRPLLLVAAEDDKESADSVRKLKAVVANEKHETKIYPKGGHGTDLFAAKVGLEDVLEQFLLKSL